MRPRISALLPLLALLLIAHTAHAGIPGGPALDHFNVYVSSGIPPGSTVQITDQFGNGTTSLGLPELFMVPTDKNDEGIQDPFGHLTCYLITDPGPAGPAVIATNQFGSETLTLGPPKYLCAPTEKLIDPGPIVIDHYQCYEASGPPAVAAVFIGDQFQQQSVALVDPFLFCNPVDKNGEGVSNPTDHLTCYNYTPAGAPVGPVGIANQFFAASTTLDVLQPIALCAPTEKQPIGPEPVDHFSVYNAIGPDGPIVSIDDQFGNQVTDLGQMNLFMVPANKNNEGIFDPISHLACHQIVDGDAAPPQVTVDNQFGPQTLDLGRPTELCVPTEKLITPGIVTIDHFRCFEAFGPPLDIDIDWSDQFQGVGVTIREPFLLCNPAEKNGEAITNPDDHLVCYFAEPPGTQVGQLDVVNQFNTGGPITILEPFAVCVPSSKQLPGVPSLGATGLSAIVGAIALTAVGGLARAWRRRRTAGA